MPRARSSTSFISTTHPMLPDFCAKTCTCCRFDGPKRWGLSRKTWQYISNGVSEFLGTGMLVFFGCLGTMPGPLGVESLPAIQVCLTFGFVVTTVLAIFGCVSHSHLNPSVTLAAFLRGRLTLAMAILYIVSQCLGAILGFGLIKALTPCEMFEKGMNRATGVCGTIPNPNINLGQAVLAEFLASCAFIFLANSVWDPRNAGNTDGVSIKFGLLVAAVAMAAGPYSGASMNPARSLGPAVWNNIWTRHWIYWLCPLTAAVFVSYLWMFLLSDVPEEDNEEEPSSMTEYRK